MPNVCLFNVGVGGGSICSPHHKANWGRFLSNKRTNNKQNLAKPPKGMRHTRLSPQPGQLGSCSGQVQPGNINKPKPHMGVTAGKQMPIGTNWAGPGNSHSMQFSHGVIIGSWAPPGSGRHRVAYNGVAGNMSVAWHASTSKES